MAFRLIADLEQARATCPELEDFGRDRQDSANNVNTALRPSTVDAAARPGRSHNGRPRRNLSQFDGADTVAIPTVKGLPTMMPDLTALALLTAGGAAALAAV